MLSINTNLSSLIAQNSLTTSTDKLNQAIERMTMGLKINHASDNAANYSISTNITTQMSAYMVAEENCAMGLDMITTASESLNQIGNKLNRLRDLATQSSNGTYGAHSLRAINSEANALVDEINRLYQTAEYNGKKLFQTADNTQSASASTFNLARTSSNEYGDFISNPKTYSDSEIENLTKLRDFLDGSAPEDTVYTISTAEDLQEAYNYGFDSSTTIVLANDIDLSTIPEDELESFIDSLNTSQEFNIDGNGHKISNLTVDCDEYGFWGFFGFLDYEDVTIKNVGLENINVLNSNDIIGIFSNVNYGTIENCYVKGSIESIANEMIGGLVAENDDTGIIKDCYADVSIVIADDIDGRWIGGLVGFNYDGEIINSHTSGTIYAPNCVYVGGLVGVYRAEKDLINCYSTCDVTGNVCVGGLIGGGDGDYYGENAIMNCNIINCYSTGDINGNNDVGGITSAQLCYGSVSNCYTTGNVTAQEDCAYGLLYWAENGVENCYTTGNITARRTCAIGLCDSGSNISNCFTTGNVTSEIEYASGLGSGSNISNCFTTGNVISGEYAFGICEYAEEINNCYTTGHVEASNGGIAEGIGGDSSINCASVSNDSNAEVLTEAEILARYTPESMGFTADNGWTIVNGQPLLSWQKEAQGVNAGGASGSTYIILQVGISSGEHSSIGLELGFSFVGVDDLRMIGLDTTTDFLTQLDNMLFTVNAKEVEYGAAQNRLESALDEISIKYENLASSRSTIRDADIADVSSEYIKQQILQQASATLMATANQAPAIALQLI